ncbi:unnamed protein product [Darwinula stevensoni]|uniref:RNA polymerase I-specific transcription initiation factor RRN3 n=1 Tax=Darwinula stevensoni TaxID=69355 RepID=A0A7R8WYV9_9CRUS|nr:unnamed protein product [Darwinula stevensoni]CAG0879833.1 unnamed protein product [Darwinula stevensoni]
MMSRPILKSPRTSGISPRHLPADRKVHLNKSEPVFGRQGKVGSSLALEQSDKTVTFNEKVNMRVFQKEESVPLSKKFESLLKMLTDGSMDEGVLAGCLRDCGEKIAAFDRRLEAVVNALLRSVWPNPSPPLQREYESFISALLTAHCFYTDLVLKVLIAQFLPRNATSENQNDTSYSSMEGANFALTVMKLVLKIVPIYRCHFPSLLKNGLPFLWKSKEDHHFYLRNLLHVSVDYPDIRSDIFLIIFDRLLELDMKCSREDLLSLQAEELPDAVFKMDIDSEPDESQHCSQVLDILMQEMCNHVHKVCHPNGVLDVKEMQQLFKDMWSVFERLVLPARSSSHVQFLLFYLTSFHPQLPDAFVDNLWKIFERPSTPPIIRQLSVGYMASYLARASFVSFSLVKACLELFCSWIHCYIDSQDNSEKAYPSRNLHRPFYAACQAAFYLFAFRHQEFVHRHKRISFLQSLNFERIVSCQLNPLKLCHQATVRNFASVTRHYQLAYCYTIIERNRRSQLPTVILDQTLRIQENTNEPLEPFFPFDPYLLPESYEVIKELYREYKEPQVEEPKVETKENEEDDFLNGEDIGESNTNAVISDLLGYSISPGFLHRS